MIRLVVHGGAGPHRAETRAPKLAGCELALDAGWSILESGGSAMDAVEAATRVLENDPLFDAGYGSYLNADGTVELDAIVMDGEAVRFGAVAAVQSVRHPITLARRVLEASPHAMLAGDGALRFAESQGLRVPPMQLVAPRLLEVWQRDQASKAGVTPGAPGDTVGAVARDAAGHLAAATSTGGTRNKWPGRVGDSPLVGSGAYADDKTAAISCTGNGESIMRVCMAYAAHHAVLTGASGKQAAVGAVDRMRDITGGEAGLILVTAGGEVAWHFNTPAMPFAWRTESDQGSGFDAQDSASCP